MYKTEHNMATESLATESLSGRGGVRGQKGITMGITMENFVVVIQVEE
ncbi:MAG: hypothetical protein ACOCUP_01025 [bacterium]